MASDLDSAMTSDLGMILSHDLVLNVTGALSEVMTVIGQTTGKP